MSNPQDDGWTLRDATRPDIEELMQWFPTRNDVLVWGGPSFRYPFTDETFFEDIHWGKMAAYSLADPAGQCVAFGQVYDRDRRIHLARLVVAPHKRGSGIGRRLVEEIMLAGRSRYPHDEFSLFVLRDNTPARECYKSLGFVVSDYPADMPHGDVCYYLTRPVTLEENDHAP